MKNRLPHTRTLRKFARVQRCSFGGLALLLQAGGCDAGRSANSGGSSGPAPTAAVRVTVASVIVEQVAQRIPAVGTVFALEETTIAAKVEGVLTTTLVDVGQKLMPGDTLAEIEPDQYELAVAEAEAALEAILAELGVERVPQESLDVESLAGVTRAAAEVENARFTHNRLSELRARSMLSDQEFSVAVRDLRVAEANLTTARDAARALAATARQRDAALDLARRRLNDARLKAPPLPSTIFALLEQAGMDAARASLNWVVAERSATEGQFVTSATPLYRLIVADPVLIRAEVPQRYSDRVSVGLEAEVEVRGAGLRTGRVCRLRPTIDPANRTLQVDVLVSNAGDNGAQSAFRPGGFTRLFLITRETDALVTLPALAVRANAGVTTVFVMDEGTQRVNARTVQVARRARGEVSITGGLLDGELVVMDVPAALADGQAVEPLRIQNVPMRGAGAAAGAAAAIADSADAQGG